MTRGPLSQMGRFLWAVVERISEGHFGLVSAGVAFYAMFAVFPTMAAVVAIWGMVADPVVITGYLAVAERMIPEGARQLIHDQVMGLVLAPPSTLGWATFVSLSVALYSARNGVSAVVQGLDVVHRTTPRGWVSGIARDFVLTLALIAALLASLCTVVLLPIAFSYLPYLREGAHATLLARLLPWAAMIFAVLVCLSILFRYGPNVARQDRPVWFSAGVIFAALAWGAVSFGFSLYLENFNAYNRIYGSIGAVIILMMWLYLSVLAILAGGAINAEVEQRRILRRQMGREPPARGAKAHIRTIKETSNRP